MSSPFATFRKNQKIWMAMAVFIAVVAFVISPMIEYFSGGSRSNRPGDNRIIASWAGGSIRQGELEREYSQIQYANAFLRKLAMEVQAKGGTPNVPEFNPNLSVLGITSDRSSPEFILERKLLVAEANRMGIHFDDSSVTTFLKRFVDGKVDGEKINQILKSTTDGKMNLFDFNRLMREELTKNEVLRLAHSGLQFENRQQSRTTNRPPLTTPSKNWQDFLKFNRAAKIQAFPVFVNDFESQVKGKPTEREIQDLYQEGKETTRSRRTIATQPAFKRPKTVSFEYLSIDVEKIVNEQIPLVPQETLLAEYERRVKEKQFRVPIVQEAVGTPTTPEATSIPTENAEPLAIEPTTPPALPDPKEDEPVKPTDPKDNASRKRPESAIKLVAFQEEPKASQEPAPSPVPSIELSDAPPADAKPTQDASLETAPSTPAFPQTGEAVADSTPMRTKSFDEVKDQIAREQAFGLANKVVEDRIAQIYGPMSIYQSAQRGYLDAVALKAKDAKAPDKLDLAKLGAPLGFEYGSTGMVDIESIQGTPIGSSFIMSNQSQQPLAFAALVGASDGIAMPFYPNISMGFTGGNRRFVSWKTEEIEPITPAADSIRDQIEDVWKKQQAFKLAEARAREIASKVGTSTLKDSLSTEEEKKFILEPAPFTWFNPMFARMESRLQLSNIELLQPVDDSFMEAVFACGLNDTTVASDASKTMCYVVQVSELTPDITSLFERFGGANLEGVSTISRMDSERTIAPWFQNLQKQLGFQAN